MPRIVSEDEKIRAIELMIHGLDGIQVGQRDIEKITNLSRPYIRKLARSIGHQFDRNGIEVQGEIYMCANCGNFGRRAKSKITRAKQQFCDVLCKQAFLVGPSHPNWRHGKTAESFSKWVSNQKDYKVWKEEALQRADYKCEISGREQNLDVHHCVPKSIDETKAFDPQNALVLNREIHTEIHQLISKGKGFQEAIDELRKKYKKGK